MTVIATYTLLVRTLDEEPAKGAQLPGAWSGYLLEAEENLSKLLPDGYFVTIRKTDQEGESRD